MKTHHFTSMILVAAVLYSAGSLSAQDAESLAGRKKSATTKPDKMSVEVLATDEEKMEVAEAIDDVQFDFDRATINPDYHAKLKGLAAWMKDKNVTLRVSGFADGIGTDQYNKRLSERRARAVKTYLVINGANPKFIDPVGYGEANPLAGNESEPGRRKNRLVEFALF